MSSGSATGRLFKGPMGWFTLACLLWVFVALGLLIWYFSFDSLKLDLLTIIYLALTILVSPACFLTYWVDKRRAVADKWRVSEKTLHLLGLFCGWPGAQLAQTWLRHKTQKMSFRVVYWLTVLLHLFLIFFGRFYFNR